MLDLDVDVRRIAEERRRDRVHVEDEAADCHQTHHRPPTFLYRPYASQQAYTQERNFGPKSSAGGTGPVGPAMAGPTFWQNIKFLFLLGIFQGLRTSEAFY